MAAAVTEIDRLDRAECRLAVERRFSPAALVRSYLPVYASAARRARPATAVR
jgi:hypothetical protein